MKLIRQIDNDVKPKWDEIKNGKKIEGPFEDCPPSLLKGWTDDNPSLWEIDIPEKPDLNDILVALCRRKKDDWDKISYLLFNKSVIKSAKLDLTQINGKTGDVKIDTSNTHYEIKNVYAKNLCALIYYILNSQFEVGQFKKSQFFAVLLSAYDSSQMVVESETDAMSIKNKPIDTSTNTGTKKLEDKVQKHDKIFEPKSSGSVDPSTGDGSSMTSQQ